MGEGWIYNFGTEEECSHYTTVVPRTEKFCILYRFYISYRSTRGPLSFTRPTVSPFKEIYVFDLGRSGNGQIRSICSITTTKSGQNKHNKWQTSASNENQDKIQLSFMTKFRILSADLWLWYPVTSHIFNSDDLGYKDTYIKLKLVNFSFSLQTGHYSSLTAPNLQPTANQERNETMW